MLPRPPAPQALPVRRTARPGCRTRPGPRTPRRRAPAPSRAPRRGRTPSTIRLPIRKSPCTSTGGDGWPAGWPPASGTPTRTWRWCRPSRRAARATARSWSSRAQAGDRAGRRGGWRPAPARIAAAAGRGAARRRRAALNAPDDGLARDLDRRSGTDCPVRQANRRRSRMCGTGAPGRRGRGLGAGLELHAGVHVVGRRRCAGSARRRCSPRDGVERPVVRLAPPVSARRFSIATSAAERGASTAASCGAALASTSLAGRT